MYSDTERQQLLATADAAIRLGPEHHTAPSNHQTLSKKLLLHRACFVTLRYHDALRGCIGSLTATEPLIDNVAHNAHSAAFNDTRFEPVNAEELEGLTIHISILSETQAIEFSSEQELLLQLRPGIDGLLLSDGHYRGTFLPSVWKQLPAPDDFFRQLKIKAGLVEDYWSDSLKIERYTVESISN